MQPPVTYQQFRDSLPRLPGTQAYLVEGDISVYGEDDLRAYYDRAVEEWRTAEFGQTAPEPSGNLGVKRESLTVNNVHGIDTVWDRTTVLNLTYCVSTGFGVNYTAAVNGMSAAVADWQNSANVRYVYVPSQDANCNPGNAAVVFHVLPTSGFNIASFFPNDAPSNRNIYIGSGQFGTPPPDSACPTCTLTGWLRQAIGHSLGFRHEDTRSSVTQTCWEDTQWRPVTANDATSVMYSPLCGRAGAGDLVLSAADRRGAACIYGPVPGTPAPFCDFTGIVYQSHVQNLGWLNQVWAQDIAGTVGQSLRMEAIDIGIRNFPTRHICYQAHVQNLGWQNPVCDFAVAGTVGQSLRLEAIKIIIKNSAAWGDGLSVCNVFYQAHVSGIGWMQPAQNGGIAGTTGISRAIEALRIYSDGSCGF